METDYVRQLITPKKIQVTPKMKRLHPVEASLRLILRSDNLLCGVGKEKRECIRQTLKNCYVFQKPLTVNITFGSYKGRNVYSKVYANWAEVLNLKFMLDTLSTISEIYPHGVVLEYVLQDLLLEELNNINVDEVRLYIDSFREIVNLFQTKESPSVAIRTVLYSDLVDSRRLRRLIGDEIEKVKEEWIRPENETFANEAKGRARRNLQKVNPSENEITESAMFHTAYVRACGFLDYLCSNERLFLVHRKTLTGSKPNIPYRSFHSSAVQFWVGEGCLVKNGVIMPTILSGTQLAGHRRVAAIENKEFNTTNPNLKEINVYEDIKS